MNGLKAIKKFLLDSHYLNRNKIKEKERERGGGEDDDGERNGDVNNNIGPNLVKAEENKLISIVFV